MRPSQAAARPAHPSGRGVGALRRSAWALRLATSVALLWLALRPVSAEGLIGRFIGTRPSWALLALAVLTAQAAVAAFRWWVIARRLGSRVPYTGMVRFAFAGLACSQVLPSTLGGDTVRAWLHHRAGVPLGRAIATTLIDRMVGLVGLLGLVGVALLGGGAVGTEPAYRATIAAICVLGLVASGALVVLGGAAGAWLARFAVTRSLRDFVVQARLTLSEPTTAAALLALSVATHAASVVSFWSLMRATGFEAGALQLTALVLSTQLIAVVPVSVAGWGVRESILVAGLGGFGVPPDAALAVSVLFGLAGLVISLPGTLFLSAVWSRGACRPAAGCAVATGDPRHARRGTTAT